MIDEACHVAVLCWVDDLTIFRPHHVGARRYLVLFDSFLADRRIFVEHLAHILHHKRALGEKFACSQAPSLFLSLDRVHVGVLLQLKPTITASIADGANLFGAVLGH